MAALTIDVPDHIAEALRAAELPAGALEADGVVLKDALRWSIESAAREIVGAAEGDLVPAEVAALASRIESLAWVYGQIEGGS